MSTLIHTLITCVPFQIYKLNRRKQEKNKNNYLPLHQNKYLQRSLALFSLRVSQEIFN